MLMMKMSRNRHWRTPHRQVARWAADAGLWDADGVVSPDRVS
jgi:hypothetical protein